MAYAYVENGVIKNFFNKLPTNWKNISGLHLSKDDDLFLNNLGWYKIIKQEAVYDQTSQRIYSYEYIQNSDHVLQVPLIEDIPPEELLQEFNNKKNMFMVQLRQNRNFLLTDSDWTQSYDVIQLYSQEFKTQWAAYRQTLRDLPQIYEQDSTTDINLVIWPEKPTITN